MKFVKRTNEYMGKIVKYIIVTVSGISKRVRLNSPWEGGCKSLFKFFILFSCVLGFIFCFRAVIYIVVSGFYLGKFMKILCELRKPHRFPSPLISTYKQLQQTLIKSIIALHGVFGEPGRLVYSYFCGV